MNLIKHINLKQIYVIIINQLLMYLKFDVHILLCKKKQKLLNVVFRTLYLFI